MAPVIGGRVVALQSLVLGIKLGLDVQLGLVSATHDLEHVFARFDPV